MTLKDCAAVVGVGATPYYRRGESLPQTTVEMAGKAILAACADAGLSVKDIDGFAYYGGYTGGHDTGLLVEALGIPEIRFSASLTQGGGGAAGAVGLAAAAIHAGMATHIVTVMTIQQAGARFGSAMARKEHTPESSFIQPSGLTGPGQLFALMARRHMHLYGTKREHFAEVAISTRANAIRRPTSIMKEPLTLEQYFAARVVSDPLCLYDYCLETDGAVAIITTSAERAKDLKHRPVYVMGTAHGGDKDWGRAFNWLGMKDEIFTSSGHRPVARRVYEMAGVGPKDIDVALIYDHFTPMVIMQLEDYGFCKQGEGGPFVADGNIRWPTGSLPVNTHGGNLSEAYIIGLTHTKEAVEQLRGAAINQVPDAEIALVTGGPAAMPVSATIFRR